VTTTVDVVGAEYAALARVLGYTTLGFSSWVPLDPMDMTEMGPRTFTLTGVGDRGRRSVSGRTLDIAKAALLKEMLRG